MAILNRNKFVLNFAEISRLVKAFAELGVSKISSSINLIRNYQRDILKDIKSNSGIKDLVMTTNAYKLNQITDQLIDNGLTGINISIDSLNREKFKEVTGHDRLPRNFRRN